MTRTTALATGLVVVLVGAIGAYLLYDNVLRGDSAAPLALPSAAAVAPSATTATDPTAAASSDTGTAASADPAGRH